MAEHTLEVRAVRPTTTQVVRVPPYVDRVMGYITMGYYLGCAGCMAADPTTHKTKTAARATPWRHPAEQNGTIDG